MKNYDSIKGLINKDALQQSIDINQDDYGGACVNVAINVMKHLDSFEGEFNIGYSPDMTTPHGIICKCDDQGGITGFMAGAARSIVAKCHVLGWKFYIADVLSPYSIEREEEVEKAIKNVVDAKLISYNEAKTYATDLISRYKSNV
jgi:hypothetical protein